jgi:HSP20 family protein
VTVPVLERISPVRDLDLMERWMRRVLSDYSTSFMPAMTPAADVYETDGELVVELEVPGFAEQELEIEVSDHTLTVKGSREEDEERTDRALKLHERLETAFERRFVLPLESDPTHVEATYGKGVLTLHVPKTPEATPRRIPIGRR